MTNTFFVILFIIVVVGVVVFTPIKYTAKIMLNVADKKIYYSIVACNLIKINCGLVDFSNTSIKILYANKTIKFITLNDLIPNNDKVNLLKHFSIVKFSSAILLGDDLNEYKYYLCALINCLNSTIYSILQYCKPFLKYKNDLILLGEESSSGLLAEIDSSTNLLSLILVSLKKLFQNIISYRRDKNVKGKS